jgi:capsular polysaccharide transport system permease protein
MLMQRLIEVENSNGALANLMKKMRNIGPLFIATVAVPVTIAILYFGIFASDVYISESRFVVRSPDKPASSGLGVLLKSAGFSNAGDEIYAAQEYVLSRDALAALNNRGQVARAFSGNFISIFDRFNPMVGSASFEDLYKFYQKKISVQHDASSSITTLTVRAYTPQDARWMNERLLEMAEATVNRLNVRGRQDLIRFAQAEVDDAAGKARTAALALSVYRTREGVLDPEKQATVQVQLISKLQDELISARSELAQLRSIAPQNPQIPVLQTRITDLARQIDTELGKVAGGQKSLAVTAVQYQKLALESQFADRQVASALTSLEEARNEARRKQAYVERIVQPNLPDEALEPRRLRGILATLVMGLVAWGILTMLLAGVREHQD